jgi:hypothetical protein
VCLSRLAYPIQDNYWQGTSLLWLQMTGRPGSQADHLGSQVSPRGGVESDFDTRPPFRSEKSRPIPGAPPSLSRMGPRAQVTMIAVS